MCADESLSGALSASGSCLNWSRLTPVTVIKISEQEATDADQRLIFFLTIPKRWISGVEHFENHYVKCSIRGLCSGVFFVLVILFGFKLAITGR